MNYGDYVTLRAKTLDGKFSTRIGIVMGASWYPGHVRVIWDSMHQETHILIEKLVKL